MSKEIIKIEAKPDKIAVHNLTIKRIGQIKKYAAGLEINGIADHKGLKQVVTTRKKIKDMRLGVEVRRKDLNADMLREIRENNTAAKFIKSELLLPEKMLRLKEKHIEQLKEARRLEKKAKELERLQKMVDQLTPFGIVPELNILKTMSDADFSTFLDKVKYDFEAEKARKVQEQQKSFDENEKLRAENERLKGLVAPPPVVAEVENKPLEQVPPPVISEENTKQREKAVLKLMAYVTGLNAVPVPDVAFYPNAAAILFQGKAHIDAGIKLITDAI